MAMAERNYEQFVSLGEDVHALNGTMTRLDSSCKVGAMGDSVYLGQRLGKVRV